jgi:hypothetical protein
MRLWESMLNYGSCLTMRLPGGKRSGQKGKVSGLGPAVLAAGDHRIADLRNRAPTGTRKRAKLHSPGGFALGNGVPLTPPLPIFAD